MQFYALAISAERKRERKRKRKREREEEKNVPCDRYSRPKQFPDRSIKTRSQMSMPAIGTPITQSSA